MLHLHGEISKSRSTANPELVYDIDGWELKEGDKCEEGSQLRPHIVWFGESVPMMDEAIAVAETADLFAVVGTSLVVYPAAGLITVPKPHVPRYIVDPNIPEIAEEIGCTCIQKPASTGVPELERLLESI